MNEDERNNDDEKEAESSSSSSGKEGNGGGYSADCSASDEQSLDGNNNNTGVTNPIHPARGRGGGNKKARTPRQDDHDASSEPKERRRRSASKSEDGSDWEDLDLEAIRRGGRPQQNGNEDAFASSSSGQQQQHLPVLQAQLGVDASTALAYAQWNGIAITDPMDHRIDLSSLAMASATYASLQQQQQRQQQAELQQQQAELQQQQQEQTRAGQNLPAASTGCNDTATGATTTSQGGPNGSCSNHQQMNAAMMVSLESYARLLEVSLLKMLLCIILFQLMLFTCFFDPRPGGPTILLSTRAGPAPTITNQRRSTRTARKQQHHVRTNHLVGRLHVLLYDDGQ
jgi:hypothetical protein